MYGDQFGEFVCWYWRVNKASKHHNKIIQSISIQAGGEHNYVTGET